MILHASTILDIGLGHEDFLNVDQLIKIFSASYLTCQIRADKILGRS